MASQHVAAVPFVPLMRSRGSWWKMPLMLLGGVLAVGLGALLEVPMVPVPMSMQTYSVVVVGALAGWRLGAAVVVVYLAAGAVGVPILAGGASGIDHVLGNTAGYLVGFVIAAATVGIFAERGWTARGFLRSSLIMLVGHGLTLCLGTVWLSTRLGWSSAIQNGFLPFLVGAVVKSLLAAATVEWLRRRLPLGKWQ